VARRMVLVREHALCFFLFYIASISICTFVLAKRVLAVQQRGVVARQKVLVRVHALCFFFWGMAAHFVKVSALIVIAQTQNPQYALRTLSGSLIQLVSALYL